ncbi:MAG: tail protein X, partial [Paracoccaceae bacterium]
KYGVQAGAVERVLEANPAIRDVAHRLPRGTTILLPDLTEVSTAGTVPRLWD